MLQLLVGNKDGIKTKFWSINLLVFYMKFRILRRILVETGCAELLLLKNKIFIFSFKESVYELGLV
jgi:hypothetical protein